MRALQEGADEWECEFNCGFKSSTFESCSAHESECAVGKVNSGEAATAASAVATATAAEELAKEEEAEARAKREAEEKATRTAAEEQAKRDAEEKATRTAAEEQAKAKKEAEEQAKREAERRNAVRKSKSSCPLACVFVAGASQTVQPATCALLLLEVVTWVRRPRRREGRRPPRAQGVMLQ